MSPPGLEPGIFKVTHSPTHVTDTVLTTTPCRIMRRVDHFLLFQYIGTIFIVAYEHLSGLYMHLAHKAS